MTRLKRTFSAVFAIAIFAGGAGADSLSFTTVDTSGTGVTTQNPDGSFRLQTLATSDKASVKFLKVVGATPQVLGSLSGISGLSADLLKASPANTTSELAIRIFTNQSLTQGLVWENAYNGSAVVPVGGWEHLDFTAGNFWQRTNGVNYFAAGQEATLASWESSSYIPASGVKVDGASIYGIEVSFGSGAGIYDGDVANVHLDFSNGASYTAAESQLAADATATPLPSAAMGGLACLGLFAIGRRRRGVIA